VLAFTNTYGALFSRVIYTEWIFFAAMAAGLMILRRRPEYRPLYRVWGYPLVPIVFIAASIVIVVMQIMAVPRDSMIGLGMVLLGLPVYVVWSKRR
jgi:APA family basic amino acid/polyamine antiporter